MAHPGGRPTDYKPEYCQAIIDYFSVAPTTSGNKTITTAKGTEITEEVEKAVTFPTLERFAHTIGVNGDTLVEWAKKHEEFSAAYTRAKALQKDILIANGMKGLYNPQFTIFVAKNCTDMKDKVELDANVSGGLQIEVIDRFAGKAKVEGSIDPSGK